jgi:GntR family transcriptional repressor for pyruvate dehydrogenase complex
MVPTKPWWNHISCRYHQWKLMFQKVKPSRLYEEIVFQIEEAIETGKLKPGDRLPPERELKGTFNTSRRTLREGLRVLENKGLIEIKTGPKGGAFVKQMNTDKVRESLGLLIRYQYISLEELAEFRIGLEGTAALLAAQKASTEGIAELKELLAKSKACVSKGTSTWDEFMKYESRMHLTLVRMTQNLLYESVVQTILENIHTYYDLYLPKGKEGMLENYKHWSEIVEALEKGQPDRVNSIIKMHIRKFSQYMKDRRFQQTKLKYGQVIRLAETT